MTILWGIAVYLACGVGSWYVMKACWRECTGEESRFWTVLLWPVLMLCILPEILDVVLRKVMR